ncbi:MAG: hypothetical protein A2V70_07235 [Planctomycetes bacterium RBG_13_63_9]|nr:MAG: hypothetical protein A2V70_07235 [Planctomycetes bacterium RBG_13_63_9]
MVQPGEGPKDGWWSTVAVGVLLTAVIFCYPLLLGTPLLDPDEGLHASIAQAMVERGDWITPSFLGRPFLDKPILFFWAEALSLRLFGMGEAAVRLPGLMFGLLGALTTALVGWRMFGRTVGTVAGLFYATMFLPAALAQAAAHDVALIPWVNLALLLFWESDRATRRRAAIRYIVAIGVLLGLTCLTKGLVGVALVGLVYGTYLIVTRQLSVAGCIRGAAALGIAALVAAVWYVPAEVRNPGYLHYYFIERHLLGYATETQTHGNQPWWYYLPILLGGGLPWIGYLPATIQDGWIRFTGRHGGASGETGAPGETAGPLCRRLLQWLQPDCREAGGSHGAMVLLWCWLVGCTLFLSTSHSKLVTYIWPVFPSVAILAAVGWGRLVEGTLSQAARRTILWTFSATCLTGVAVLPVAMLVLQAKFAVCFSWPVWTSTGLVAVGSWWSLGFLVAGRLRETLLSGLVSLAAQYAVIMATVLPHVAAATSARDLADHFNRLGRIPDRLVFTEDRIGSFVFYLDRELRAGLKGSQLQQVRIWDVDGLPAPGPDTLIALPERRVERARRYCNLGGVAYQSAGEHRLYKARELEGHVLMTHAGSRPTRR